MYEKRKKIISTIELAIRAISLLAFGALMLSVATMIEALSVSTTPLVISIVCLVWFGLLGLYIYIFDR